MLQSPHSWGSFLEETNRIFSVDVCKRMTCKIMALNQFHIFVSVGIYAFLCCYVFTALTACTRYLRHWKGTCSVESGSTVVVGVVQHQHNGWSWCFWNWWVFWNNSSRWNGACSRHFCGGGSSCSGGNANGAIGLSRGFQDNFGSSILWLFFWAMMHCECFGKMVW